MPTLYITQAGELALQSSGLAGWTNLHCDMASAVPAPPDRQAVIGDFTIPTFTGYAQAAVVLTGGFVDGVGGPVFALTGLVKFTGPSSGAGVNVLGGVFSDGTSHAVWAWFTFDTPEALNASTDVVAFVMKLFQNETYNIDLVN